MDYDRDNRPCIYPSECAAHALFSPAVCRRLACTGVLSLLLYCTVIHFPTSLVLASPRSMGVSSHMFAIKYTTSYPHQRT